MILQATQSGRAPDGSAASFCQRGEPLGASPQAELEFGHGPLGLAHKAALTDDAQCKIGDQVEQEYAKFEHGHPSVMERIKCFDR